MLQLLLIIAACYGLLLYLRFGFMLSRITVHKVAKNSVVISRKNKTDMLPASPVRGMFLGIVNGTYSSNSHISNPPS